MLPTRNVIFMSSNLMKNKMFICSRMRFIPESLTSNFFSDSILVRMSLREFKHDLKFLGCLPRTFALYKFRTKKIQPTQNCFLNNSCIFPLELSARMGDSNWYEENFQISFEYPFFLILIILFIQESINS
jgi:hypothetical protein